MNRIKTRTIVAAIVAGLTLGTAALFVPTRSDPAPAAPRADLVEIPEAVPSPDPTFRAAQVVADFAVPEPLPTEAPKLAPVSPPQVRAAISTTDIRPVSNILTLDELDAAAAAAGWDIAGASWASMRRIVECETPSLNASAHNGTDPAGGSHGLAQLNGSHWFDRYGEDFALRYDPVVNLRTARRLHEEFGRFGGPGLWSCADRLGIY